MKPMKILMRSNRSHCPSLGLKLTLLMGMTVFMGLGFAAAQTTPDEPNHNPTLVFDGPATNGPGRSSAWSYSGKQGIGSSYEAYINHRYSDKAPTGKVSKVWFSIAEGIITETMYGKIHEAQLRELRFVIKGSDYVAVEGVDTVSKIDYLNKDTNNRPLSPAYRVTTTDKMGRFVIIKDIFTDPDRQSLMVRVNLTTKTGPITPYIILDPSVGNTSGNDEGNASASSMSAIESNKALSLVGSQGFVRSTVGFTDVNDGLDDVLKGHGLISPKASTKGTKGNIRLIAELKPVTGTASHDLVIGFGSDQKAATAEAMATLKTGYKAVLANYNGQGAYVGWEDYLASLKDIKSLIPLTGDNGQLLYASALMLKVQEDRTYPGALIASLSNPWGETVYTDISATGYKAVWPRDFYQVSMALMALGDYETPKAAHLYLPTIQVNEKTKGNKGDGGWFLQKAHVDGTPEWVGIQLDQTAMPIIMAARLHEMGILSDAEIKASYNSSLKRAADFLSHGGQIDLDWNKSRITPPYAQQERWEEQEGHSPSTTAAVISGLAVAADMAKLAGDEQGATLYLAKSREFAEKLDGRLYTTKGRLEGSNGEYYLRISRSDDANNPGRQDSRNGRPDMPSDKMVDQGFIELVRYGIRAANDPKIVNSLKVIDNQALPENLRVRYDLRYGETIVPGFRRYGNDGYGDRESGGNYAVNGKMQPDQRGRVWPIFTGERGHYELANAALKPGGVTKADIEALKATYVVGMELMANEGLMIPEQVFDGIGSNAPHDYKLGEGTNSATPLAWSHAEYIKLLRSLRDQKVWDKNTATSKVFGQ